MKRNFPKDQQTFATLISARRDKQGVLHVPASASISLRLFLACVCIFCGSVCVSMGFLILIRNGVHYSFFWTEFCIVIEGIFILAFGLRNLWLWHKLRPLLSANVLCEWFRLDVEQLAQIAVENSIRPDANVAGQDYYRVTDFGEIATLLRASEQPTAQHEILLRPAQGSEQGTPEQLLRAASLPIDASPVFTSIPVVVPEEQILLSNQNATR